jgi:hypothetical protein
VSQLRRFSALQRRYLKNKVRAVRALVTAGENLTFDDTYILMMVVPNAA